VRNGLEACNLDDGKVSVSLKKQGDKAVLCVSDNGPGIPEDLKDKIFNPYFSTKEKGTGLGLSIVHQIVDEFGGRMELLSAPGEGTQFRISFHI
jgi:signal transduction histidine kinase